MKIATWNINGMRARVEFVQHWLAARQPDIVGLQELKSTDDQFPADVFEAAGYTSVTHGQKSWNGVAILARKPARVTERGLPGQDEMGARLITAEVDDLSFTTVYVPNGKAVTHEDYARKLEWLDALSDHLASRELRDRPAVVCGDFNVCPTPLDSHGGTNFEGDIFHTDAERSRFARILDAGFVDLYRHLHPETRAFSWWDYRGGAFHRGHGLRIDFLLGTAPVVERLRSVEIDRDYRKKKDGLTASDHAPVIAEID